MLPYRVRGHDAQGSKTRLISLSLSAWMTELQYTGMCVLYPGEFAPIAARERINGDDQDSPTPSIPLQRNPYAPAWRTRRIFNELSIRAVTKIQDALSSSLSHHLTPCSAISVLNNAAPRVCRCALSLNTSLSLFSGVAQALAFTRRWHILLYTAHTYT